MRIIKPGVINAERLETVTCQHCHCEFEFLRGEAKVTFDQRDGDFLTINCPCCGNHVTKSIR